MRQHVFTAPLFFLASLAAVTACNGSSDAAAAGSNMASAPTQPSNGAPSAPPATGGAQQQRTWKTDALLFEGTGTWSPEVASLKSIMQEHGMTFDSVSSAELDGMPAEQLANYGMIIWPGGSGGTEANSIKPETRVRIRKAVQETGVNWLGFCAGSFVAVAPTPADGGAPSYGLGIVNAPELQVNDPLEKESLASNGTDIAMTLLSLPDGSKRDVVWYGGPNTPEVKGGVVARYPEGAPAISEMMSGKGFVMLSGPHPTATQAVRDDFGLKDSDGLDLDMAWTLIQSTLKRQPMKAF